MWRVTVYFVFDRRMCMEGAVLQVLLSCLSMAGAVRGALLQAGSWFLGPLGLQHLLETHLGFGLRPPHFIQFPPWSAEALRPACICEQCKMRLGWA